MSSRERILKTLNHEEPDRVPLDLAATTWTGITHTACQHLRDYMGLPPSAPEWSDVIQQIVIPEEKILDDLEVDIRGVFPITSHNDDVYSKLRDGGEYWEYQDEWSFVHHFPKNGYWFSLVKSPMESIDFSGAHIIEDFAWPDAGNPRRFAGLRERAIEFRNRDKIVFTKGLCAGLFEMHQRIRGMTNAMTDHLLYPGNSDRLVGKLADLKIEFWEEALNELGDVVDIVGEGDDYGTQWSQLIGPEQFREYYKPHFARVLDFIRNKAPGVKLMFHSCGNIRPIIPDFIEMGVDILNPVHITAEGMEPTQLKRDFGSDIVFWGGGIDTQKVLPHGTPSEITDHVRSNLDALAPGGGYVFCTVHNIQAEVPAENLTAMYRAYTQYRDY